MRQNPKGEMLDYAEHAPQDTMIACSEERIVPKTMKTTWTLQEQDNLLIDAQYTKVWWKKIDRRKQDDLELLDFVKVLATIGNEKINVLIVLIDNVKKSTNEINLTQRAIRDRVSSFTGKKVSLQTVSVTIKSLERIGFIKRINPGNYILNPDVIFRGSLTDRIDVVNKFGDRKMEPNSMNIGVKRSEGRDKTKVSMVVGDETGPGDRPQPF